MLGTTLSVYILAYSLSEMAAVASVYPEWYMQRLPDSLSSAYYVLSLYLILNFA